MFYMEPPSPTNNWPSNIKYQSYTTDKRVKIIGVLIAANLLLVLSVAAIVIVFAVEHAWFHDSFNYLSTTTNQTYSNQYGLWRLCIFANQTCGSWFSSDPPFSLYTEQRLNQSRGGIFAWQALEIVFLFLTTSTSIIALSANILYAFRKAIHYYLAILTIFCIWPAACIGISGLFVFGFSVYSAAQEPRGLDWCFYVNIAAVVLSVLSAILLTIYGFLLKKPIEFDKNDIILDTLGNFSTYPANLSPSSLVIVKPNKHKGKKAKNYSQILYPSTYYSTKIVDHDPNTDYITNPNHQMLSSTTSPISQPPINPPIQQQPPNHYASSGFVVSPSTSSMPPPQSWYYQPPIISRSYEPPHWQRPGPNPIDYGPNNDYVHHGVYRPNHLNPVERSFEMREHPRILHFYTGYDHFSTIDPSDLMSSNRHQPPYQGSTSPMRYTVNPSYYQ